MYGVSQKKRDRKTTKKYDAIYHTFETKFPRLRI